MGGEGWAKEFLVKMGKWRDNLYRRVVYRRGGQVLDSLVTYGLCGYNALYSVDFSFTTFIFLLTHSDT